MALTEEPLRNYLNKIAEEQNYKNPEIIINDLSSGGANYTSKLYTAIIKENNKEDINLFAKVAAVGENFRKEVPRNFFNIERFAYKNLWKTYLALEEENGVPEEHRLQFTKFYGFDETLYQETLVLENLLTQGYGPCDRVKPFDWEYASSAATECAKMHALSFAFQKNHPDEYEKSLEFVQIDWNQAGIDAMVKKSVESALKVINPEHKKSFEKFMDRDIKKFFADFYVPVCVPVIIHGDYRGSNLLHRVREDGKVDIKIVDLQTLQGGSPLADLLYLIFAGSDEQFRARYFDRLIDHYYLQLSAAMRRLHLNPHEVYSREVYDHELKVKLPYALMIAAFVLPVVTVDTDEAPEVDDSLEFGNFGIEKTNDLYIERMNGVVNDYVRWGILK